MEVEAAPDGATIQQPRRCLLPPADLRACGSAALEACAHAVVAVGIVCWPTATLHFYDLGPDGAYARSPLSFAVWLAWSFGLIYCALFAVVYDLLGDEWIRSRPTLVALGPACAMTAGAWLISGAADDTRESMHVLQQSYAESRLEATSSTTNYFLQRPGWLSSATARGLVHNQARTRRR